MRAFWASVWFAVVVLCGVVLVAGHFKLESDPLSLLEERSEGDSPVRQLQALLSSQASELVVGIESDDPASLQAARQQIEEGLRTSGLAEIAPRPSLDLQAHAEEIQSIRPALLTSAQRALLSSPDAVSGVRDGIATKLASPLGGFYRQWLSVDPLLLVPEYLLDHGVAKAGTQKEGVEIVRAHLTLDPLPSVNQAKIDETLDRLVGEARAAHRDTAIDWIGYVRFAHESATRLQSEAELASFAASIIIVLVVLFTFKSIVPVVASFLSGASGILVASALSKLLYPKIHLFTLTIGAALSGATVDYSLHFFSHYYSSRETSLGIMARIRASLLVGVGTSCLAFAALGASGLRGLEQIAFFSVVGLIASFFSVFLLYPYLIRGEGPGLSSPGIKVAGWVQRSLKRAFEKRGGQVASLAVLAVLSAGLFRLHTDNDVRSFQSVSPALKQVQERFNRLGGEQFSGTIVHVKELSDDAYDDLVARIAKLQNAHALAAPPLWLLLPGAADRSANESTYRAFLERNREALRSALLQLGMSDALVERAVSVPAVRPSLPEIVKRFLAGAGQRGGALVLPLTGVLDVRAVLAEFSEPASRTSALNYATIVSDLLEQQMSRSIWIVALAYLVITASFVRRYGFVRGGLAGMQALIVAAGTLGVLGLAGLPIDFFSVLALVIVLGLCIDFGIFFIEEEDQFDASSTSVVTSAVTTIGAFSVLAFSSARVLVSFGLVISIGVFFSMVLAPLVAIDLRARRR